jgi:hypothetical protein
VLRGFRKILVTESVHPYLRAWWSPGHVIVYEHTIWLKSINALSIREEAIDRVAEISSSNQRLSTAARGFDVELLLVLLLV